METEQKDICKKYNTYFEESPPSFKIGISLNVKNGIRPINGLRHSPQGDTSGWYIWEGEEYDTNSDFFIPLHIEHLTEWCPFIIKYLGLPPGWRFLVTENYEDVWQDKSLLDIKE